MSVYVDRLRNWGWRLGPSSHLIADTVEELHAFAERIGLRREWFQDGRSPHYDLTAGRRTTAVRLGAVELGDRDFHVRLHAMREKPILPSEEPKPCE